MSAPDLPVVIEAALNGARERTEHPAVPLSPEEVAGEAARCSVAGATVAHVHARTTEGGWSADPAWYGETIRRIRSAAPGMLIGVTSIRPSSESVWAVISMLETLSLDPATRPDLVSINIGHIAVWESVAGAGRRTSHFPNDYHDITALLRAAARLGITPELGVMDLGFVGNAVALRDDGALPPHPWFLVELDSPCYGQGAQVAPATCENYDAIRAALAGQFPEASWAAHGNGPATYAVIERALSDGAHVRVGFEGAVVGPDGERSTDNAEQVRWAVGMATAIGRRVADVEEARRTVGVSDGSRPRAPRLDAEGDPSLRSG